MENNNIPAPILQLRQDDVVAISLERYEELIEFETRLGLLRKMRFTEITLDGATYIRTEDYVLGGAVLETLYDKLKAAKEKKVAADE